MAKVDYTMKVTKNGQTDNDDESLLALKIDAKWYIVNHRTGAGW